MFFFKSVEYLFLQLMSIFFPVVNLKASVGCIFSSLRAAENCLQVTGLAILGDDDGLGKIRYVRVC